MVNNDIRSNCTSYILFKWLQIASTIAYALIVHCIHKVFEMHLQPDHKAIDGGERAKEFFNDRS